MVKRGRRKRKEVVVKRRKDAHRNGQTLFAPPPFRRRLPSPRTAACLLIHERHAKPVSLFPSFSPQHSGGTVDGRRGRRAEGGRSSPLMGESLPRKQAPPTFSFSFPHTRGSHAHVGTGVGLCANAEALRRGGGRREGRTRRETDEEGRGAAQVGEGKGGAHREEVHRYRTGRDLMWSGTFFSLNYTFLKINILQYVSSRHLVPDIYREISSRCPSQRSSFCCR